MSEPVKRILLCAAGATCFALAVFSVASGKSQLGVIIGGIVAMPFLYGGGVFFGMAFSPIIADRLVDFLFLPRRYLSAPPEILSPAKGMIEQERYPEAISVLEAVLQKKPFDPEATLLLADLYYERLHDDATAEKIIADYFKQSSLKAVEENIQLLFLYCDHVAPGLSSASRAKVFLQQELTRKGYSVPQRKLLQNRLDSLSA